MKVSDMNFELLMEKALNFFGIKRELESHIDQLNAGIKKVNIGVLNTITTAAEKLLLKMEESEKGDNSAFDKMDHNSKFLYQSTHIIERLDKIKTVYIDHVFEKSILKKLVDHIDDLIKRLTEAKDKIDTTDHLKDLEDEINKSNKDTGISIKLGGSRVTKHVPKGLAVDLHTKKQIVAKDNKLD